MTYVAIRLQKKDWGISGRQNGMATVCFGGVMRYGVVWCGGLSAEVWRCMLVRLSCAKVVRVQNIQLFMHLLYL